MSEAPPSSPQWYVFQTGGNQEFFAERQLNRQRFDTYVPCEIVDKLRMGVVIGTERRALFRSYGFVRFNVATDRWRSICHSPGVKRLLSTTPEHPIAVPDATIESLQWAVLELTLMPEQDIVVVPEPAPTIVKGMPAEVQQGTFAGRVGIVQSTSSTRAKLLMEILGSKVPVSFRLVNLRPATNNG